MCGRGRVTHTRTRTHARTHAHTHAPGTGRRGGCARRRGRGRWGRRRRRGLRGAGGAVSEATAAGGPRSVTHAEESTPRNRRGKASPQKSIPQGTGFSKEPTHRKNSPRKKNSGAKNGTRNGSRQTGFRRRRERRNGIAETASPRLRTAPTPKLRRGGSSP